MNIRVVITMDDIKKILNERGVILDCKDMRIGNSIISNADEIVVWIECIDREGG